jgi:hypothetical protein
VGIVRRVVGDEQGNRYVGIQMLATGGAAVTLFPKRPEGGSHASDGELCILLPATTTLSGEATLLLRPDLFSPRRTLEMQAYDRRYRLHPVAITEAGEDFEIARFRIEELT